LQENILLAAVAFALEAVVDLVQPPKTLIEFLNDFLDTDLATWPPQLWPLRLVWRTKTEALNYRLSSSS
jgi:hypothetical protein